MFTYTYQKGYKTATSLFYLGEVAYVQRLYKDALGFYKKSVQVYPKKTSYMDRLLYHTGRSFMKLGEKELAVLTFKKLIKEYNFCEKKRIKLTISVGVAEYENEEPDKFILKADRNVYFAKKHGRNQVKC